MNKGSKIYVAGHRGMVGSAITRQLQKGGYNNLVSADSSTLDLRNKVAVHDFFKQHQPEYVFLAAAKVGGILANINYPSDFLYSNLMIQNNVIEASFRYNVSKLLFLGSAGIYPKLASQPIKEESLLGGPLDASNEAYAIAKIAGIKLCQAYCRQYGRRFISVVPANVYGLGDNYHPENSHVLPGLLRRFHEAKESKLNELIIWGSGVPLREFMFADDLAEACLFLMERYEQPEVINVGTGEEVSILQLAEIIAEVVGFKGRIELDRSKPDGPPRKLMDSSRLHSLGFRHQTSLKEGIALTYQDFLCKAGMYAKKA